MPITCVDTPAMINNDSIPSHIQKISQNNSSRGNGINIQIVCTDNKIRTTVSVNELAIIVAADTAELRGSAISPIEWFLKIAVPLTSRGCGRCQTEDTLILGFSNCQDPLSEDQYKAYCR